MPAVVVRLYKKNKYTVSDYYLLKITEDNDGRWLKFADWLKLDMNSIGCRINDLEIKCLRAIPIGPGFESHGLGSWMYTTEESHTRLSMVV